MARTRKSITFDLDTNVTGQILGDYHKAYSDIQRFMEKKGFLHPEYSVDESPVPMTYTQIRATIDDLLQEHPYLEKCVRDMRTTSIQTVHTLNHMFSYDGTPGEWVQGNQAVDNNQNVDCESMTREDLEKFIFSGGTMQTGNEEIGEQVAQMGEEDISID